MCNVHRDIERECMYREIKRERERERERESVYSETERERVCM